MRNILCFARGREGSWEALCIDFDIAVQGASFSQVQADFNDAVAEYVEAARQEDAATRERLLNRRAPLSVMIVWSLRVLRSAWRHGPGDDTSASFPVACAA
jgi:hypothetical protein